MELSKIVNIAKGAVPADLVLRNAQLVNVFTGEIYATDIAIVGSRIAGLGDRYEALCRSGRIVAELPPRTSRD